VEWARRQIHVSWLIALACFVFVVAMWLALYVFITWWWVALAGLMFLGLSFWRRRVYTLPILVIGAGLIGVSYGSIVKGDLDIYRPLIGREVSLQGRVRDDPSQNAKKQLVLQLDSIQVADRHLPGSVWVSVIGHPDIKRSDEVVVKGEFVEGFGTFAGVMYTAKIITITHPSPADVGREVRDWFADAVRRAIPEPQASLGIGYLTGQKSALPSDLSDALQIAGLSHIVVASGYNLTILVRLARRLFVKVSKFMSALSSALMIAGFIAVTGLSPSMTRAGLVSGLSLATWYYGRRFHPFVLLPFAAAMTVLWQPSYVWGDLGWQLSFSAFAGVMIVAPLLQRFFFGEKSPGVMRQILGETVAAHFATIPIVVLAFGVLSNVAILANIMIVPLVPLAMLLTFISGIAALVAPAVAELVGMPATWLLGYMTHTAQFLAELPWSQTKLTIEWWVGGIYYLMLFAACFGMQRVTKFSLRETNIVE
jgi:competence protein ComEC